MRQIKRDDLGLIRFVTAPRGSAPLEIRKEWVGVEVPCLFSHDGVELSGDTTHDVVSGLRVADYPAYVVLQVDALAALEKRSPAAAKYWVSIGFPNHPFALLQFNKESAEVVKPVMTRQEFWKHFNDA